MIIRQNRLSFTAGELSPWASSRVDMDLFTRGASRIRNFVITPFGGLCRRPGFAFINEAPANQSKVRLVPFQYSTGDAFILEFSPSLIRFYRDGNILKNNDGTPYTVSTPWLNPDQLHLQQINDILYICGATKTPHTLSRYSDKNWQLAPVVWKYGPWKHNFIQNSYVVYEKTPSIADDDSAYFLHIPGWPTRGRYGGTDYLRLSVIVPDENQWVDGEKVGNQWFNVGRKVVLSNTFYNPGDAVYYEDTSGFAVWFECISAYNPTKNYAGNNDPRNYPYYFSIGVSAGTPALSISGKWEIRTFGTWSGEWLLQKSYDNGRIWTNVKSFFSSGDANFITNGSEEESSCLMRLRLSQIGIGKSLKTVNFKAVSHRVHHCFELLSQDMEDVWTGNKLNPEPLTNKGRTYDWSISAFGSMNGYPKTMTWHQNRMIYGSTQTQPQTLWISASDDYQKFQLGSDDADAMELTLAANSQNSIQWLYSQQRLFLGTTEGEWTLDTSDGRTLTPSNPSFTCHSHQGADSLIPIPKDSSLVFIQKGGTKVREMSYHLDNDGFLSNDLTLFAGHISESGIKAMCLYEDTNQTFWFVKNDGEAVCMTWIPSQNVLGWNRHSVAGGRILSLTTIRRDPRGQELWAVIERGTGSTAVRTIERLGTDVILPTEDETFPVEKMPVYMDSHVLCQSAGGKLTGLAHLRGQRVTAYPQSDIFSPLTDCPVSEAGEISLPASRSEAGITWVVGIPYVSLVTTTPFDQPETLGQLKNHVYTRVKVLHSWPEMEYSSSINGTWYVGTPECSGSDSSSLFSGYVILSQAVVHQETPQLSIRTSSVLPLNILTLIPNLNFEQDQ